jgi:peroxiredoxin
MERKGSIRFRGIYATVTGNDIQVGQAAPEFRVQTQNLGPIPASQSNQSLDKNQIMTSCNWQPKYLYKRVYRSG